MHCQTTAGDCLISVAERREALVSKHYLNACRDPDPEKQGPCIEHELEQRGEREELASFYETENWCSRKLLECMTAFSNDAEQMAIRQRTQDRREQVEAAPESAAAERAPEFAKEKLRLRALDLAAQRSSRVRAQHARSQCEKALDRARARNSRPSSSKPPRPTTPSARSPLYAALQRAEAECSAPELSCLLAELAAKRRQPGNRQAAQAKPRLAQPAANNSASPPIPKPPNNASRAGVTQHSDRIVSAYQAYAAHPRAALLVRLQKAFIAMHQAQLWCLMPLGKPSKR